jgi:two-component system sensor histidine kinase QseC
MARASLVDQFDQSLTDKARLLASTLEYEHGRLNLEFQEMDMAELGAASRPACLELWGADGSALFRAPSLRGANLKRVLGPANVPSHLWVALPGGRPGRAVVLTFVPRLDEDERRGRAGEGSGEQAEPVTLSLARDTTAMNQALSRLRGLLLLAGLLAVLASAVVLGVVVRRSLKPVDRLAAEIGGLDEQALATAVEVPGTPAELQPVVDRLNDLLRRLDAAFAKERSFSANVAHELRTPLSGLRSTMEVALTRPRPPDEYQEALGDCLAITSQMQAMVENLLSLAKLEAGSGEIRPEPVAVDELVRDLWEPFAGPADARRLHVHWQLGDPPPVVTDASLLSLAVGNLLDNAVAYTEEGDTIEVESGTHGDQLRLCVRNAGSKLAQEDAERAFNRFWRGDAARSDTGIHCGLGLSLVKRIAVVLGGSVAVKSREGGDFEVTLSIPCEAARLHG